MHIYSMRRAGINRPRGLLPRCRLFLAWPSSMGQAWGCSPIKKERELGLDFTAISREKTNRRELYVTFSGAWTIFLSLSS